MDVKYRAPLLMRVLVQFFKRFSMMDSGTSLLQACRFRCLNLVDRLPLVEV